MPKLVRDQYDTEGVCMIIKSGSQDTKSQVSFTISQRDYSFQLFACILVSICCYTHFEDLHTDMGRASCEYVRQMGRKARPKCKSS